MLSQLEPQQPEAQRTIERMSPSLEMKKMITKRKIAIPKTLRELPMWFVTGHTESDDRVYKMRYSARTLSDLRWNQPSDFSGYDEALEAAEDHIWIEAVALRIAKPYIAITVFDALEAKGGLSENFLGFPKEVGGYWEKRSNRRDVLGILQAESVPHIGFGLFNGFQVFVSNDGVTEITGKAISKPARDPAMTNVKALDQLFSRIQWGSIEPTRQSHTQLSMFGDQAVG